MSEPTMINCSRCKKNKIVEDFIGKDGKVLKMCIDCREYSKKIKIKNLCPHKKQKYQCVDCNGGGMCIHKKRKYRCVDCNGNGICIHKKQKSKCLECGGSALCIHKKRKQYCLECGGSAYCIHNKRKYQCVDCNGYGLCIHKRQKNFCKKCGDEVHITTLKMVNASRSSDKKYDIFDEKNIVDYIDYDYVKNLIIESNDKCCYCHNELQFINYANDLATIERIDNSLPHIKGNCLIACKLCNCAKVGDYLRDYLAIA